MLRKPKGSQSEDIRGDPNALYQIMKICVRGGGSVLSSERRNRPSFLFGLSKRFMETQFCTGRRSLKTVTYVQIKRQISQENRPKCPLMAA